jgi:two-component system LytT family response regulator
MKALIIDNEDWIRDGLAAMIAAYCPTITEIAQANGVETGWTAIQTFQPDIVFLDVEMDDGTGMDLLAKFKNIPFQVIFTTAHQQYAVDAFRFSAIDFLLKPVDSDELVEAVVRANEQIKVRDISGQLHILRDALAGIQTADKKIALRDSEAIHFVPANQIIRCEADGGYTKVVTTVQKPILVSKGLKEFEEMLSPLGFVRCHHSHLIQFGKILRYERADGGMLVLENGDAVPISQRKKDAILELLNQF